MTALSNIVGAEKVDGDFVYTPFLKGDQDFDKALVANIRNFIEKKPFTDVHRWVSLNFNSEFIVTDHNTYNFSLDFNHGNGIKLSEDSVKTNSNWTLIPHL